MGEKKRKTTWRLADIRFVKQIFEEFTDFSER